jgi:preprotein translocase YajC subunit
MLSNSYVAMLALSGPAAGVTQEERNKGMFMQVGMMVFFGIIFYVMLIRPQQKRAKEQSKMLNELAAGDKVTTSSGIVGIVVGINPQDYRHDGLAEGPVSPLDGMAFQRHWESRAFELGGGGYMAPGQLVGDFIRGQASAALGSVEPSYKPGVHLTDLGQRKHASLPLYAIDAIREALPAFERQIKGFNMPDDIRNF